MHKDLYSNGNTVQTPSGHLPNENHPEADEANLDALNEVIMAVDMKERGTVGCCYYVARDEKLYFMEDVKFGSLDVVDACTFSSWPFCCGADSIYVVKTYIEPTVILLSTKVDDSVIDMFDPEARNGLSENGCSKWNYVTLITELNESRRSILSSLRTRYPSRV